jgi:atrophin-1 interacting protein 1
VKKVLDSSHCGGLEEGDRLIAIDGIDLRGLSHTQVVQVLKDFPLGREATLTIQRVNAQVVYSHKFNTGKNSLQ